MQKFLKNFFSYFFVFLFFFLIFYWIQFSFPYFLDTDPWYHIRQAWMIRNYGIEKSVKNFPFMWHTILRTHPADLWFGYHLLLIPFTFGDLIFGAKLSSVIFASLVFLTFFWLLKKFKIKYPFFWTLLLFLATYYYFNWRLLLPRPYPLSIIFSLLGFYFLAQKKYFSLFILSFLWFFTILEAPLILAMAFLWILIEWWQIKKIDFKILFSTIGGGLFGTIIRPDFPHNLYFLFYGVFNILFLSLTRTRLPFGLEIITPFIFNQALSQNLLIFIFFVLVLFYFIFHLIEKDLKKQPTFYLFLAFFSLFFGLITLTRAVRFVEYWVPFSTFFGALFFNSQIISKFSLVSNYFLSWKNYQNPPSFRFLKIYQIFYRFFRNLCLVFQRKSTKIIFGAVFFFVFLYAIVLEIFILSSVGFPDIYEIESAKAAALWLKENTPPHSIVLNKPWHLFPYLFFFNQENYYSEGMDPTFNYLFDKRKYWLWRNIAVYGKYSDKESPKGAQEISDKKVYQFIKNELQGDYILLETEGEWCQRTKKFKKWFEKFQKILDKSPYFEKVFEAGKIVIYKVK